MKLTTDLADIHKTVSLCIKESMCTYGDRPEHSQVCPLYVEGRSFTASPGGLVYLVRAILEGKTDYGVSLAELAFTCSGCGACEKFCELLHFPVPHVGPWEIIRLLRYELVKRGFIPEGEVKALYEKLQKNEVPVEDREGVNLGGDGAGRAQKEMQDAAIRLLSKAGRPASLLFDEDFCGSTLYDLGFWDPLGRFVEAKWETMKDPGDREYVFTNPHCQEFVLKRYPEILPGYRKIRSRHISEVLADSFKAGALKSRKLGKVKVSYHDPCYLGRGLGVYEAPREALTSLDGVELIEMKGNRVDSFCCGARSTGHYFTDFSKKTALKRLEAFSATAAEILITACPHCKAIFQAALPEKDKGRVKDLSEFIDERTE